MAKHEDKAAGGAQAAEGTEGNLAHTTRLADSAIIFPANGFYFTASLPDFVDSPSTRAAALRHFYGVVLRKGQGAVKAAIEGKKDGSGKVPASEIPALLAKMVAEHDFTANDDFDTVGKRRIAIATRIISDQVKAKVPTSTPVQIANTVAKYLDSILESRAAEIDAEIHAFIAAGYEVEKKGSTSASADAAPADTTAIDLDDIFAAK